MPRSPPLISMLEIISLVGKEQLGSSPVSVQQLVLETLPPQNLSSMLSFLCVGAELLKIPFFFPQTKYILKVKNLL